MTRENIPMGDETRLELHEEQLRLYKKWALTGEVNIHIEVLTEEKSFVVPISREELVIERIVTGEERAGGVDGKNETIRIPISEERIKVTRHQVRLEDVSVYRHRFQELRHIEETLKKERINMKTVGDVNVIEKDTLI